MYNVLTQLTQLIQLIQQVKPEQIAEFETPKLADAFLLALKDCKDIRPSQIISVDCLESALGYKRDFPSRPPVISDSDGDKILMELMAAWQWLKREVFVIPRPDHLYSGRMVGTRERPYYITKRGYDRLAELINKLGDK